MENFELSENTKFWLTFFGYVGVCLVLTYAMYKMFAIMVGKEVAKALIASGVIAVL